MGVQKLWFSSPWYHFFFVPFFLQPNSRAHGLTHCLTQWKKFTFSIKKQIVLLEPVLLIFVLLLRSSKTMIIGDQNIFETGASIIIFFFCNLFPPLFLHFLNTIILFICVFIFYVNLCLEIEARRIADLNMFGAKCNFFLFFHLLLQFFFNFVINIVLNSVQKFHHIMAGG